MSAGPETTFIKSVHTHVPDDIYWMKNHNEYNGGIADCWYSRRLDLWIEYKFITIPVRPTTMIDLCAGKDPIISLLQQEWLKGRHGEGRTVGVIVGAKEGGVWFPGTEWNAPISASTFRSRLQSRKDLAALIASLTDKRV